MGKDHRWLTPVEYAEAMGMNPATVRRLCSRGKLPAEKTGGTWRVYYEPPGQAMRLDEAGLCFKKCALLWMVIPVQHR